MTDLVRRLLGGSRFVVLLAVAATFLSAVVLTVYGAIAVVAVTVRSFRDLDGWLIDHHDVEHVAIEFLSLTDIFLLCTVLYIIALGLYELFIDPNLPLPNWLLIEDLDDLKEKLGGVVIVLIAVNFLGSFVPSNGDLSIVWLGISGAAIILAIAVAFAVRPRHSQNQGHGQGAAATHEAAPPAEPTPGAGG